MAGCWQRAALRGRGGAGTSCAAAGRRREWRGGGRHGGPGAGGRLGGSRRGEWPTVGEASERRRRGAWRGGGTCRGPRLGERGAKRAAAETGITATRGCGVVAAGAGRRRETGSTATLAV